MHVSSVDEEAIARIWLVGMIGWTNVLGPWRTSRRHMPMYSVSLRVLPTSTSRLEGEIIFIFVTLRSMMSAGRSNSSTMHSGMAPPHGCTHCRGGRSETTERVRSTCSG